MSVNKIHSPIIDNLMTEAYNISLINFNNFKVKREWIKKNTIQLKFFIINLQKISIDQKINNCLIYLVYIRLLEHLYPEKAFNMNMLLCKSILNGKFHRMCRLALQNKCLINISKLEFLFYNYIDSELFLISPFKFKILFEILNILILPNNSPLIKTYTNNLKLLFKLPFYIDNNNECLEYTEKIIIQLNRTNEIYTIYKDLSFKKIFLDVYNDIMKYINTENEQNLIKLKLNNIFSN